MILAFADVHLRDRSSFPPFNLPGSRGLSMELENTLLGFEFVAEQIRLHKPEAVFFLGDLFHHPDSVTTTVLHAASLGLSTISSACATVGAHFYLLPGNHDTFNDDLGIHLLSALCPSLSHTPHGHPILLAVEKTIPLKGGPLGVVPYCKDPEAFFDSLRRMSETHAVLVTHFEFQGALYETGISSKSAVPSSPWPCPIIAGDQHLAQSVGDVHYPGSLVQNRFNRMDLSGAGGVLLFDFDENHPDGYTVRRVRNHKSRHYLKMTPEHLDTLKFFKPDEVIVSLRAPELPDDMAKVLGPFWHVHVVSRLSEDHSDHTPSDASSPRESLREFLSQNHPELLSDFEEVSKELMDAD
jgi:hypothetical protein